MDLSYDPPRQFRTASDQLHELVAREAGADDFGPEDYRTGLEVLLRSMDYDPQFTERGRRIAWGMVVGVLKGRVHALKAMKAHPGFDDGPIRSPVVITGIPRSGTTALHRLLAVDRRFQGLQTWLLDRPMPRPAQDTWEEYPQFHETVRQLEARYAVAPDKRAAHHMIADQVEECCLLLRQGFASNLWSCGWSAATYDAWWQSVSEGPSYRHYYRCVQLIGSNDRDRRWLLKNPGHVNALDLLFAIYPDARVIQTHRDPARAIPSICALLMRLHNEMEQGRYDQRAEIMGQREVAKWSIAVDRAESVREQHPGQVMDVRHGDFHREPMRVVEQIYRFIGMELDDELRAAFRRRIDEKPELAHGAHRYDIADFGLVEDAVRERFGDYVQRYELLNA
jgi:hypothetical protein